MRLPKNIQKGICELWAYYPGRHRASAVWLILIPIIYLLFIGWRAGGRPFQFIVGTDISFRLYILAGKTLFWVVEIALISLLLRVTYYSRRSWQLSLTILWSSVFYALLVVGPAIALVWSIIVLHVGVSLVGMIQIFAGVFLFIGALVLLTASLCVTAHYCGFITPFLLFSLIHIFPVCLGIIYPLPSNPDLSTIVIDFVFPTGPAIRIIREGLFSNGDLYVSLWAAAIVHAIAGCWVGIKLWPHPYDADRIEMEPHLL